MIVVVVVVGYWFVYSAIRDWHSEWLRIKMERGSVGRWGLWVVYCIIAKNSA